MAKILLDTNILIDSILFPDRLSKETKDILEDENNTIVVSTASLIEISIKHIKHPDLMPIDSIFLCNLLNENEIDVLPISYKVLAVFDDFLLEKIHNDPFDHMLLATSIVEGCKLLTKDKILGQYKNGRTIIV
ncbi:MAG: type II toxin-antitoxin system VapC family toxin [Erysipelotrichaceae bacterium]|nr:type II toxin-antitoxin system VapC family toxin [Erysipelotrichaceae bacterium]